MEKKRGKKEKYIKEEGEINQQGRRRGGKWDINTVGTLTSGNIVEIA